MRVRRGVLQAAAVHFAVSVPADPAVFDPDPAVSVPVDPAVFDRVDLAVSVPVDLARVFDRVDPAVSVPADPAVFDPDLAVFAPVRAVQVFVRVREWVWEPRLWELPPSELLFWELPPSELLPWAPLRAFLPSLPRRAKQR